MKELSTNRTTLQKHDILYEEFISFIADFTGYRRKINLYTSINFDIKIDGDDASDFMQQIESRYGVDFTGFQFNRYFFDEGFQLFNLKLIYNWVFGKNKKDQLYVCDLYSAIKRRKWLLTDTTDGTS